VDAADEDQVAVSGAGKFDGDFVFADLVVCGHGAIELV
jgi:hypothetical protein